jgi:dihydroorotate dehydrogenase electron transfer subunit
MAKNAATEAVIASNDEIAAGVRRLALAVGDWAACGVRPRPGQFVNIYLREREMLLPRPLGVCDFADGTLTLVYAVVGAGTGALAGYLPGTKLRVGGPAGNGFDVGAARDRGAATLIGGGAGAPLMLMLAKALKSEARASVRAVLGFRSEPFLLDEFGRACDEVLVATEDGACGRRGTALDILRDMELPSLGGDCFFSCGPAAMMKAVSRFAGGQGIPLQVSLEARMGCGYGACMGCVCVTASGKPAGGGAAQGPAIRRVCVDGPVFDGSEVVWDV